MGQNRYKRKPPTRKHKDTIYIVCGGDTEKIYFDTFKKKYQADISERKIKIIKKSLDPFNLIKYCISSRGFSDDCLQMWAVFDKDDFVQFNEAIYLAKENGILCAYSNQSFEVWLINHFKQYSAPLHRDGYQRVLGQLLKGEYRKEASCLKKIADRLTDHLMIQAAIQNAERGLKIHRGQGNIDYEKHESCTTVHQLVKHLLK